MNEPSTSNTDASTTLETMPPVHSGGKEDQRSGRVELIISMLLRLGVQLSLAVVVVGLIVSFVRHPSYRHSPDELKLLTGRDADFPHSLPAVLSGLSNGRGPSIVMLGLFLLIATPVMRVAVSILAFAMERDRVFMMITACVLLLLLLSFVLGGLHA